MFDLRRRTIIAVDSAGYGESFKPQAWLNVSGYAGHMANFIDALGIGKVDVLGDHTGAKIAIETARQRPRAVRRIVMSTARRPLQDDELDNPAVVKVVVDRDDVAHELASSSVSGSDRGPEFV